jgi:RNA polymerase sigma-70 factor (sigma-E family)
MYYGDAADRVRARVRSGVSITSIAVPPMRLADFAREHSVGLTRFAYLLCGDRGLAEDLVQDAFLALYRRFGEQLVLDAPVAYARRAIVNANISHARRKSYALTVLTEPPERSDTGPDPAHTVEQDAMWSALATLPERQRAVLVLRYYLDLSDPEIAAALDCREGTVRSLASRAFATLRADSGLIMTEESR